MSDNLNIKDFVKELEIYTEKKINYPVEIGELLQIVEKAGMKKEFENLILQAKFIVKTQEVMKRTGPGTDGFEKLSAEFQSGVRKAKSLFDGIVDTAPSDINMELKNLFNLSETDNFNRLMKLFYDLSWIKNWQIDGKPLPYDTQPVKTNRQSGEKDDEIESIARIQKSAISIVVLFILFLFIDTPVTVIGWILLLGIAAFLAYIVIQIYIIKKIRHR